jgi:hypothetical protein
MKARSTPRRRALTAWPYAPPRVGRDEARRPSSHLGGRRAFSSVAVGVGVAKRSAGAVEGGLSLGAAAFELDGA